METTMSIDARAGSRILVSAILGLAFTIAMLLLSSAAGGAFLEAVFTGPGVRTLRIGLQAAIFIVGAFWAFAGAQWVFNDFSELRDRDHLEASVARRSA
jgi:hypothetical protein